MDVLLEKWASIELFCRVIAKVKKMPLKDFQNNAVLMKMLSAYAHRQPCATISAQIYKACADKVQFSNASWENKKLNPTQIERSFNNSLYDLVTCIRYSRPFYTKDFVLDGYSYFIGKKDFVAGRKTYLEKFNPSKRKRLLEGTRWWLYFYDEWDTIERKTYKGISRAILELKPFGEAELRRRKIGTEDIRLYNGIFRLYKDNEYLAVKMKVKQSESRDLRLLFFIGSDTEIEIALGLSANVHEKFYARTVMIEPIDKKTKDPQPGFYCRGLDECDCSDIPEYAWLYLNDKGRNMIKAPKNITTKAQFYKWKKEA